MAKDAREAAARIERIRLLDDEAEEGIAADAALIRARAAGDSTLDHLRTEARSGSPRPA
jgi:hypothetical protein